MNLAAGQIRRLRIEQRREGAQDAALGLTAQSQQDEIMPGKNCIDDLGHNRIVVADDAGENRAVAAQPCDQVVAHLVLHATVTHTLF